MTVNLALSELEAEELKLQLAAERELTDEDIAKQTRRIFQERAPQAAVTICKLALHSPNERVQLQAATYVVERLIGRLADDIPATESNPYEDLMREIMEYAESQRLGKVAPNERVDKNEQ
jgi:hypothetical protein